MKIIKDKTDEHLEEQNENFVWVEKYRPRTLDEMVLDPLHRETFDSWLQKEEIPNVLLVGKPGSGKTTLAKIIVDNMIKSTSDLLYLNGSSQRGIMIVRDQIEDFLRSPTIGSKIKIVFIDEFDYMTLDAQAALRNIIEEYTLYGRFLLTANFESKIIDAIISRLQVFRFKTLPKEYILNFCKKILDSENVQYNEKVLIKLINAHHPDVRKIVGILQSRSQTGTLKTEEEDFEKKENILRSLLVDIITGIRESKSAIVTKSVNDIQKLLLDDSNVDFSLLYEKIGFDLSLPLPVRIIASQYYDKHNSCASPVMNYMAMISKIVLTLSDETLLKKV